MSRAGGGRAVFFLDAGGCGGCALELQLVVRRAGFRLAASPAAAAILLVAGPVGAAMDYALEAAWQAMAGPKFLVALGDCAIDGGVFQGSYACRGGLARRAPDLVIRGCPPDPETILGALATLPED